MAEMLLIHTDDGAVEAHLVLAEDGTVTVTGAGADVARSILAGYARRHAGMRGAFAYLQDYGWANGPLALVQAPAAE